MKMLGAHLSISKGIHSLQEEMKKLDITTCALFLKSQRSYKFKPLEKDVIEKFKKTVKSPEILLPHSSYLINLANPEKSITSYPVIKDDLQRCFELGIKLYNIHPGADTAKMGEDGMRMIADNINKLHKDVDDVIICIENMAGQGTVFGKTFEELKFIIDHIENKDRVGVTLDTCHLFGSGYDIRTEEKFAEVMKSFDKIVGLKYLKAMHLNDSKMPLGSKKDRHEHIGKGLIGLKAFSFIMNSSIFDDIPMVLETPEPEKYKEDLEVLKSLVRE